MLFKILVSIATGAFAVAASYAAEIPEAGQKDARIQYVTFAKDDRVVVRVQRGVITRVVLEEGEKIVAAATGFPADCKKDELEWCIHADLSDNALWVKPKDGATRNNLELRTDKRDYSFEFVVTAEEGKAHARTQHEPPVPVRVIFRYQAVLPSVQTIAAINDAAAAVARQNADRQLLASRLADPRPAARNWKYSMQVMDGAEDVAPALVFDDGRFTYFQFPANREVPTIFYISPAGEEARINFHMEGDLAVVQRLGRRFVLRLGKAVVGVWNDAFDPNGVPPANGTTVPGVERVVRAKE